MVTPDLVQRLAERLGAQDSRPGCKVTVLTGAGASSPLKMPVMADFLPRDFRDRLAGDVQILFDIAANFALREKLGYLDFELLFTATSTIASMEPDDDIALAFSRHQAGRGFYFGNPSQNVQVAFDYAKKHAAALLDTLKQEVHERVGRPDAKAAATLYEPVLTELFDYAGKTQRLDWFTTNYDRSIELIWENQLEPSAELRRGFESPRGNLPFTRFDPSSYDTVERRGVFTLNLYKLHGSLNWIRYNSTVVESPSDDFLRTNVVIYPTRKVVSEEPFATLLKLFEKALASTDLLIIIGSSLRDQHIRDRVAACLQADSRRKAVILDKRATAIAESFGPALEESFFPGDAAFGTDEGLQTLKERLAEAANYGSI